MSDFRPLGKPIRPEPLDIVVDTYEEVQTPHGPMLRNTRTGRIEQTSITPKGPQYAPYTPPEPPIAPAPEVHEVDVFTTKRWDEMTGILQRQDEDGFPVVFWGTM